MDFRHLIVTCLFSMLRLSFETQKIKENYAIFFFKGRVLPYERSHWATPVVALANTYGCVRRYIRSRRAIQPYEMPLLSV